MLTKKLWIFVRIYKQFDASFSLICYYLFIFSLLRISIGLSVFRFVANKYPQRAIRLLTTIHNIRSAIRWVMLKVILNYSPLPSGAHKICLHCNFPELRRCYSWNPFCISRGLYPSPNLLFQMHYESHHRLCYQVITLLLHWVVQWYKTCLVILRSRVLVQPLQKSRGTCNEVELFLQSVISCTVILTLLSEGFIH
jgi:hypothetical protein